MKKLTIAAIGAAVLAATALGVAGASAGGWGEGRMGGRHGMMGGPGMMGMMGPAGGPMQMFQDLDTNDDGQLTREEVEAGRTAKFNEANTDGQGGVTIAEFEPWFWQQHRQMMVRAFQFLDADGDGTVTEEEIGGMTDRMFDRMDRNGDGVISQDDRGNRGGRRGDDGPRGRWGQGPMGDGQGPMGNGPMAQPPAPAQ